MTTELACVPSWTTPPHTQPHPNPQQHPCRHRAPPPHTHHAHTQQVVQERQHAIDAAIVRVMKMRKTLAHKLLVQEVMTQLRFQLTNADLKRRIDNLIEREFLERSANDSQVYNYLA